MGGIESPWFNLFRLLIFECLHLLHSHGEEILRHVKMLKETLFYPALK